MGHQEGEEDVSDERRMEICGVTNAEDEEDVWGERRMGICGITDAEDEENLCEKGCRGCGRCIGMERGGCVWGDREGG